MAFLFSLLIATTHAGLVRSCAKFFSIESWITDDPYEFEGTSQAWLEQQIEAIEIKVRWSKATAADRSRLNLLYRERDKRLVIQAILDQHR